MLLGITLVSRAKTVPATDRCFFWLDIVSNVPMELDADSRTELAGQDPI